uniref:Uncharacterized protein n=1 Tax=Romanomermis culicivorax TaxID=13658 RepID=A0A915I061_ROMCU
MILGRFNREQDVKVTLVVWLCIEVACPVTPTQAGKALSSNSGTSWGRISSAFWHSLQISTAASK